MSNYYGSAPPNHTSLQHYATSGDQARHSNVFQTQVRGIEDGRQHQYASGSYSWTHQNQNTPSTALQNTYPNDQWQNRPNSYNYSREYYGSSEHANVNNQAYQPHDTYSSQNTQGLNQLAYASGLEPATSTTNGVRPSQSQPATYQPSTTSSVAQNRTASSVNANNRYNKSVPQQPKPQSQPAPHAVSNNNYQHSTNNQNLALDAATALANAAQSYQPRSNQQKNNIGNTRASNSPAMTTIAHSAPQPPNRTKTPLYNVGPPAVEHRGKPSDQTRPVNSPTNQASRTVMTNTIERNAVMEQRPKSVASKRPNKNRQPSEQETARQQPVNSNPQSIANLVSSPSISERHSQNNAENYENMPHYVDPTQVFNPFHKEHERKKREAVEAEARKKAEERKNLEEQQRSALEAAKRTSEVTTVNNSAPELAKPGHTGPNTDSHPNESLAGTESSAPPEDGMAVEMQKMMAKMKEFRSSNPSLFQKLWNDMRGAGPGVASADAAVAQSPSPQITQKDLPPEAQKSAKSVKIRQKKQDYSHIPAGVPLNGFRVTVEDNPEGLPDLGRFPAERRIRQQYARNKTDAPTEGQEPTKQVALGSTTPQTAPTGIPARIIDPGVAWPEPRRRAVAVAAIQLLKSNPANESIQITAQEICSLLEQNPSYLDLCTALESRGLLFQRTVFARELLKRVPELQTPVSKASTPAKQDITSISTVAHAQLPTSPAAPSQPLIVAQHTLQAPFHPSNSTSNDTQFSQQPQIPTDQSVLKKEDTKSVNKQSGRGPKAQNLRHSEAPVGSKEAAARKRDFSELIDLTELDNNDNYVLPAKEPRLVSQPQVHPFQQLDTNMSNGYDRNSSAPLRFNPNTQPQTEPFLTAHRYSYPRVSSTRPLYVSSIQPEASMLPRNAERMILAKKIDRSEALQKSYYDPKTVARDILIASGRHPSERPLNLHLGTLLGRYIDVDSDVSVFEWDAIDPGGPPLPKVEYVNVLAAPPKFKLGERVRKRVKLTEIEDTRDPKAATRDLHPTSQPSAPSHKHVSTMSRSHSSSTLKRDNLNLFSQLAHRLHQKSLEKPASNGIEELATPSTRKISIDIPVISSSQTPARTGPSRTVGTKANMEANITPKGRRGRPPGSKNKNTTFAAMKQQAKAIVTEAQPEQAPEPVQHSYKCKWVKCHAELHNVDTLKRHLSKKHISDESEVEKGQYVCWWKKCRYLEPDGSGNMTPKQTFSSRGEVETHVYEDHIQPVALKYGDGPKTTNTGKQKSIELDLSKFLYKPPVGPFTRTFSHTDPQSVELARQRFLSDSDGRSTTPLVSPDGNVDYPPDPMVLTQVYPNGQRTDKEKAEVAAQNAFMKAHGNKHHDGRRAAEEVVRAMEARKRRTGPGIDRGGCTLINEARRSTFIQAPGVSGIVPLEY